MVDFAGGPLTRTNADNSTIEPVITATSGRIEVVSARPLASVRGIRAMFDVVPTAGAGPVTLRLFLRSGTQALSETWLYEWTPPPLSERKLG
ncbi:MAG: glucan biosynthesis protein [Variovorax sp.]